MATTPQLPSAVVTVLLEKLGTDDAFRALFQQNPAAALEQAGASHAQAEGCSKCLKVSALADKATIQSSSKALTSMLTASMGQQPHLLAGSR